MIVPDLVEVCVAVLVEERVPSGVFVSDSEYGTVIVCDGVTGPDNVEVCVAVIVRVFVKVFDGLTADVADSDGEAVKDDVRVCVDVVVGVRELVGEFDGVQEDVVVFDGVCVVVRLALLVNVCVGENVRFCVVV